MKRSYNNVSDIKQWIQGTTQSCSPINSTLYNDFVPSFEHALEYADNRKGIKQRKENIINMVA